jgi:hypothetical protein
MIDVRFRPTDKWPGEPTKSYHRRASQFTAKYSATLDLLEAELRHLNAKDIVVQSGFRLDQIRNDGWPRSGEKPREPGIIVSFRTSKGTLSFPCDRYSDWQSNMRAIAPSLEALRAVDRYGVTRQAEQYKGWKQVEAAPEDFTRERAGEFLAKHSGITTLNILSSAEWRKLAYRKAAQALHPDTGGSHEDFVKLQRAMAILEAAV